MSRIVFLNTTILTCDGDFNLQTVTLDDVKNILRDDCERLSAIGHESTAHVMTKLLGEAVSVNRIQYRQEKGDIAICFKLNGRPPEGAILSIDDIIEYGFELKILIMR